MAILVGIDEAGFGPLLGPLVVSASVFEIDRSLIEADLWEALKRSVGASRRHLAGRLLVTDSKRAYDRAAGLGHLERTVLAVLRALGRAPTCLSDFLGTVCPDCVGRLLEYPWYRTAPQHSLACEGADVRIAAQVFANDLKDHGMRLTDVRSYCLDVAHFNMMVSSVKNKSNVLFMAAARLIQHVLQAFPDESVHVLVDRHGGRVHYREHLMRCFPEMDLRIVCEQQRRSAYEMRGPRRLLRVSFEVGADAQRLPVALASMISKYIRELLMGCLNRYFVSMAEDLRPTAGYWQDGLRFVDDLRTRLPHVSLDSERLVRCR